MCKTMIILINNSPLKGGARAPGGVASAEAAEIGRVLLASAGADGRDVCVAALQRLTSLATDVSVLFVCLFFNWSRCVHCVLLI